MSFYGFGEMLYEWQVVCNKNKILIIFWYSAVYKVISNNYLI